MEASRKVTRAKLDGFLRVLALPARIPALRISVSGNSPRLLSVSSTALVDVGVCPVRRSF
jgi:hypothetical protein